VYDYPHFPSPSLEPKSTPVVQDERNTLVCPDRLIPAEQDLFSRASWFAFFTLHYKIAQITTMSEIPRPSPTPSLICIFLCAAVISGLNIRSPLQGRWLYGRLVLRAHKTLIVRCICLNMTKVLWKADRRCWRFLLAIVEFN